MLTYLFSASVPITDLISRSILSIDKSTGNLAAGTSKAIQLTFTPDSPSFYSFQISLKYIISNDNNLKI